MEFLKAMQAAPQGPLRRQEVIVPLPFERLDGLGAIATGQARQPHQGFAVVLLGLGRLHQIAGNVVIDARQARSLGNPPAGGLHRSRSPGGQHRGEGMHAQIGVEEQIEP